MINTSVSISEIDWEWFQFIVINLKFLSSKHLLSSLDAALIQKAWGKARHRASAGPVCSLELVHFSERFGERCGK